MSTVHLDGVSALSLIKAEAKVRLDGFSALALIQVLPDLEVTSKIRFLNYLDKLCSLGYVFTELNQQFWNISPVFLVDSSDPKRSIVRVSALNGNGKYSGYRDFTYNRIDMSDYLSTLGDVTHITDRYIGLGDYETVKNLIAQEFAEGEVEVTVTTVGELTTYTVTVIDPNSLLWYGSGSITIGDIPEIATVIPLHSIIMSE